MQHACSLFVKHAQSPDRSASETALFFTIKNVFVEFQRIGSVRNASIGHITAVYIRGAGVLSISNVSHVEAGSVA